MTITTFNNKKGLIHGDDPKRIICERTGILRIGKAEIALEAGKESLMPMLFHGCTGIYAATFETSRGESYHLEPVEVRSGWIQPPPPTAVELMELRFRTDRAEEKIEELSHLFDTNSLNFLIY